MFSLTKRPENTISIDGYTYKVNLSFNRVLKVFEIIADESLGEEEKTIESFELLVVDDKLKDIPLDEKAVLIQELMSEITKKPYGNIEIPKGGVDEQNQVSNSPNFDFKQDAGAILASFFQQYGLDLTKEYDRMSWEVFISLFDNLNGDTPIQQIRSYREDDLTGYQDDPKGMAAAVERQQYYKLDILKNQENQTEYNPANGISNIFESYISKDKEGG